MFKVPGLNNPADIGTKFLDGNKIREIALKLGFVYKEGSSGLQKDAQI